MAACTNEMVTPGLPLTFLNVPPSDARNRGEANLLADKQIVMQLPEEWDGLDVHQELPQEQPDLHLQSLCHDSIDRVMPSLTDAIDRASGWILDRHMIAAHTVELRIELQFRALIEMYGALVSSGIELTRESHLLLTERCTCRQFMRTREERSTIMTLRLELAFLRGINPNPELLQMMSRATATA